MSNLLTEHKKVFYLLLSMGLALLVFAAFFVSSPNQLSARYTRPVTGSCYSDNACVNGISEKRCLKNTNLKLGDVNIWQRGQRCARSTTRCGGPKVITSRNAPNTCRAVDQEIADETGENPPFTGDERIQHASTSCTSNLVDLAIKSCPDGCVYDPASPFDETYYEEGGRCIEVCAQAIRCVPVVSPSPSILI